jgi:hypothetical protein
VKSIDSDVKNSDDNAVYFYTKMFSDSINPFSIQLSPSKSPSWLSCELSSIDFSASSPLAICADEMATVDVLPFKDILEAFEQEVLKPEPERFPKPQICIKPPPTIRPAAMRPFVSFEATELVVAKLRRLLK